VNVVLGLALLGERPARPQLVAVAIATVGVIALGVGLAHTPWLPLSLALTFGLYGLVRKLTAVSSLVGLTLETALLAPLAAGWLGFHALAEAAPLFPGGSGTVALPTLSGVVTALPLVFFASAAKRLSLSTLGLFQYLAPTISFLLAVAVYGEPFTRVHAFAFGCIPTVEVADHPPRDLSHRGVIGPQASGKPPLIRPIRIRGVRRHRRAAAAGPRRGRPLAGPGGESPGRHRECERNA
jgi:chloramphenicol-sensitive protein RarD